jgi:hypothetical protein
MTAEAILSIHTDIFNRALKEQDYAALEGLYASDYMLVRPDGFRAEQAGGVAGPAERWIAVSFIAVYVWQGQAIKLVHFQSTSLR